MEGLKNLSRFIYENWAGIVIVMCVAVTLFLKIRAYFALSKEERIEIAKAQVKEAILAYVADAEEWYQEYEKGGALKRAEVIQKIYRDYPALALVVRQEELIRWIDELIDESLETMKGLAKKGDGDA